MPKLVSDVTTQARYILGDTKGQPRYTETELISHVNALVGEVKRLRPDMFDTVHDVELPTLAAHDEFPLNPFLFMPAVFYVAGMAELVDDEHATAGRATTIIGKFYASITTPGA